MAELLKKYRCAIWVIIATCENDDENESDETCEYQGTGFSVSKDVVMTCFHLFKRKEGVIKVQARTLECATLFDMRLKHTRPEWDTAELVFIDEKPDIELFLEFAENEKVDLGKRMCLIGNPDSVYGEVLIGRIAYPCIHNPDLSLLDDANIYNAEDQLRRLPHLAIGHERWSRMDTKHVSRFLPVVKYGGFTSGQGLSGGPVFNEEGRVIGMHIANVDAYRLAVHARVLKFFLQEAEEII